ncbi:MULTISPECIES: thioesterase II family protein [unclassified Streptomyces]|uniref:thioesterase II family protein n=1 Tax=unclassified Streptomyces TaxID=2593676 RepID=UPI001F0467BA|nr:MULTISPECIES: alpha/beta fold hydrolase [unclassified Streptomyces]
MNTTHENKSPWLRRFTTVPGGAAPLVCFPHAGGAATSFRPLSQALAPDVEVLAVQYPGRQDRRQERSLESIAELADAVVEALGPELPADCAFFGHSLGAVLAFEVARRYERQPGAAGPVRIFASARRAPSVDRDDRVHLRDDAGIIAEMQRLSGTDQEILADPELMALVLPTLRADYKAIESYRPAQDARVRCPITALVGDEDPVTTVHDAAAWHAHSAAGATVRVLPGGHFYLDPQIDAVAREVRTALGTHPGGTPVGTRT